MLLDAGYKELVLTGINTALYGTDRNSSIEDVVAAVNDLPGDFRIRLSSLEPTVVDKNDVERIIRFEKLCHHLHLSAQSGSTHVLNLMNRHYTQQDYLDIVNAIHNYDPLYNITTDIIVGFSGETEEDFQDSIDVVRKSEFGKVHIFRYSKRKGTVGEKLPDEVPGTVKTERSKALSEVADETARKFMEKNYGVEHRVLVEEKIKVGRQEYYTGYTGNYIRVYIDNGTINNNKLIGNIITVRIEKPFKDGCLAELVQ